MNLDTVSMQFDRVKAPTTIKWLYLRLYLDVWRDGMFTNISHQSFSELNIMPDACKLFWFPNTVSIFINILTWSNYTLKIFNFTYLLTTFGPDRLPYNSVRFIYKLLTPIALHNSRFRDRLVGHTHFKIAK